MNLELYPFQAAASEWLSQKPRAVLGSDPGTGKSAVAIRAALHRLARVTGQTSTAPHLPGVFIICPAGAKYVWEMEIYKFASSSTASPDIEIVMSGKQVLREAEWTIFSYNMASSWWKRQLDKPRKARLPLVIIFDEAHAMKSLTTERTRMMIFREGLARQVPFVWFLSGTPFPNNIVDCYPVFSMCTYGRLGKFKDFAEKYAHPYELPYRGRGNRQVNPRGVTIYKGLKRQHLPALMEVVRPILHRDKVEDILPQLPDTEEILVPMEPTAEYHNFEKRYEEIQAEIERAIEEGRKPIGADGRHCPEAQVATMRRELGECKIAASLEVIEDLLQQNRQIVIFAHHRSVVHGITAGLKEALNAQARNAGKQVACITGDTSQEERRDLIAAFQRGLTTPLDEDPPLRALVLSVTAAGQMITLTAASVCVFVEIDWTPALLEQAMKRIHRIGQKNFCRYYFLYFKASADSDGARTTSFDEMIYRLVMSKRRQVDHIWAAYEGNSGAELPEGPLFGEEPDVDLNNINWSESEAFEW